MRFIIFGLDNNITNLRMNELCAISQPLTRLEKDFLPVV